MEDHFEIVIGDRARRMGLTLEKIMNHSSMKFFFYNYRDTKAKPQLKNGKLYIRNAKCDMFFLHQLRDHSCEICEQPERSLNVTVDLNAETVLVD